MASFSWLIRDKRGIELNDYLSTEGRGAMGFNTITYDKGDGIGVVTLNRPKSLNALCDELIAELGTVFDEIGEDRDVAAVIITGSAKAFAAGADIKEISQIASPAVAQGFVSRIHAVFNRIEGCAKPVIAAISGFALGGGCELALACDLRIAAENAVFGLPEIKLGVIPGGGGTQRLPRLVGVGRAKELLYTGDSIDAQEAYRIGLVNKVVPPESLMDEARTMAAKLAKRPPVALKMTKLAVNEGINMDLYSAIGHESRCFEILFSTADQKEGMQAFIEKREAKFSGS
jgi:enoyl-CoA hydratase